MAAFAAARSNIHENADLFERVHLSLAEARERRSFRLRLASALGAFVLANAVLALSGVDHGPGIQGSVISLATKAGALASLAQRLAVKGEGEVSLVVMLDSERSEVEVKLPGRYSVSPQIAGAIKAIPGIVSVEHI